MKKFFYTFIFINVVIFSCLNSVYSDSLIEDNFPGRTRFKVNDYAGVLSFEAKSNLEKELQNFQKRKKIELIVTVIPDLGNMTMDDFMAKYTKKWFVMPPFETHRRIHVVVCLKNTLIHIGVGYPLMRVLHSKLVSELIEQDFIPPFEQEGYESGILAGVRKIISAFE